MKKTTAIICIVAALLVGVAVTVYAQVTYATVSLKWDKTTVVLNNMTPWEINWKTVATAKGIAYGDCDAACRKAIVGDQLKTLYEAWLRERLAGEEYSAANATVQTKVTAAQGTLE